MHLAEAINSKNNWKILRLPLIPDKHNQINSAKSKLKSFQYHQLPRADSWSRPRIGKGPRNDVIVHFTIAAPYFSFFTFLLSNAKLCFIQKLYREGFSKWVLARMQGSDCNWFNNNLQIIHQKNCHCGCHQRNSLYQPRFLTIRPIETMQRERDNASFNVKELTYFLDGGRERTEVG